MGPVDDLMWALPGGTRRLLVPTPEAGRFVSAVYGFDDTVVTPLRVRASGRGVSVHAPELRLELHLVAGWALRVPVRRPPWFTRWVEAPVARRLLGVRTWGVSPTGVQEWYQAVSYRPLAHGWASLDGRDLGPLRPVDPPVRFGFSEPPRRPSMVGVRPVLHDPSGRLEEALRPAPG
ncbi:MAG: hypothetical protein M3O23_10890 [Actinomycetota bacterium]|nr:hypothetical protein [Actinomycetota bacterium]